jgi:hypothetical protein
MPYGRLNDQQAEVVRTHVAGRWVADLGASDLVLARQLLRMKAACVEAVDTKLPSRLPKRMLRCEGYFHDYTGTPEVGFVSWPVNWQVGLPDVLRRIPTVIYLGTNVRGTACGDDDLWRYLVTREVLAYSPDPDNSLIVYGPRLVERELLGEEWAALDRLHIYGFEEAEAKQASRRIARAL